MAVALPDGMLVATSDLRAPGPVHFTLLAAARAAVGRALRTRAAVFAHRPPCEFSGLDDLDAAHAARGCNLICCVPIHAVPEAGQGGLPVAQARRRKSRMQKACMRSSACLGVCAGQTQCFLGAVPLLCFLQLVSKLASLGKLNILQAHQLRSSHAKHLPQSRQPNCTVCAPAQSLLARAQAGRGASAEYADDAAGAREDALGGAELQRDAYGALEERVASAPAGVLAASLRRSGSGNGRRPPLGGICLGMHDDIKLNAFAKFRCAAAAAGAPPPRTCSAGC